MNMQVIKTTEFQVNDTDHTSYVLGLKGRTLTASTLVFSADDFTVTGNELKFNIPIAVKKEEYIRQSDGTTQVGLRLIPEDLGIPMAEA